MSFLKPYKDRKSH